MRVPVCAGPGASFRGKAVGKTRAPPGHWFARPNAARRDTGLWQPLVRVGLTWDHAGADGDLSDRAIQPGRWLVVHAKLQPLACSLNRLPKDGTAKHMPFCAPRVSPFPSGMVPKDRPIKPCHHPAAWLQRVQP